MNLGAFWASLPYWLTGSLLRAGRVAVYGAIPALALFVADGNSDAFVIALRASASAAILALLDKGQREVRASRAAEGVMSGELGDDAIDEPDPGTIGAH